MKREIKINMLVSALLKLIAEELKAREGFDLHPQITFVSETEVQLDNFEFPEFKMPSSIAVDNNPLFNMLEQIIGYSIENEERDYLECLYTEDDEAGKAFDFTGTYDENAIPGHIYHIFRQCQEFIEKEG